MNKALEEIKTLKCFNQVELNNDENVNKSLNIIEKALLELKAIKEANPSEAMEDFEKMIQQVFQVDSEFELYRDKVKQHILKSQEQEKVLEIIKEKPFESGATINYIKTNKDNLEMLDYNCYCMNLDVDFRVFKEEFEMLKRYCDEKKS